jgi:hypothetical protein
MLNKISKCNICGKFFDSRRELKEHKDKDHRITDSKMASAEGITNQAAADDDDDNNNNNNN